MCKILYCCTSLCTCTTETMWEICMITNRNIYFAIFREFSLRKLQKTKANFRLLPRRHQEMLPNFKDHVKKVEKCIEENQNFLFNIVSHTNEMFENRDHTRTSSVRCVKYTLYFEYWCYCFQKPNTLSSLTEMIIFPKISRHKRNCLFSYICSGTWFVCLFVWLWTFTHKQWRCYMHM